jgi:phosphohistidine phosphatase
MKRLILLRHAEAAPKLSDDIDRVLSPRGREQMQAVARHLAAAGRKPDLALVSPAARTRETWSLAELPDVPVRHDGRIYEASTETLLEVVQETGPDVACLVVVGHNPAFQELAHALVGGGEPKALARMHAGYPPASVAAIDLPVEEWSEVGPGRGRLAAFETPASLAPGRKA